MENEEKIIRLNEQISYAIEERNLYRTKSEKEASKFKMLENELMSRGFKIHNISSNYMNITLSDESKVLVREILEKEKQAFNKWLTDKFGDMVSGYFGRQLTEDDIQNEITKD